MGRERRGGLPLTREVQDKTHTSTLFDLLPDDAWEALRRGMTERRYERGDLVVSQGTLNPDFHVLVEGTAAIVATSQRGERRELGRIGVGECAGEMSLLTGEPASADVVALGPLRAFTVTQSQLSTLGDVRGQLMEALSAILAGRLRAANERLLAVRPANAHLIVCGPDDLAALAGLPDAIARTTGRRAVAMMPAGTMIETASSVGFTADAKSVQTFDADSEAQLHTLLDRIGREFDDVLLFGTEHAFGAVTAEAASVLHVVRDGARYVPSNGASNGVSTVRNIVIGNEPWTEPTMRRLAQELGRPAAGILPPSPRGDASDPNGPTMRLARVITNRRVGLALGAGAAKGLAHIGVLRALREMRVPIDAVAGCSIGGAIAAGVAARTDLEELTDVVMRCAARAVRPTLPLHSFMSNAGIGDEIKKFAGERRIEDLDLPLALVATDLFRRSAVTMTSGRAWPRILASMAMPGIYPPSAANGSYLVDGGVLSPVPVQQCRDLGAGIVIGVRLTGAKTSPRADLDERPSKPLAIETIMRTFEIMLNRLSELSQESGDVNMEVRIEGTGGLRDFKRTDEIAGEGYRAALNASDAIAAVLPYVQAKAAS